MSGRHGGEGFLAFPSCYVGLPSTISPQKVFMPNHLTQRKRRSFGIPHSTDKDRAKGYHDIVFAHYGNKCLCCGETEPKFLTLDHINNDGHMDRGPKRRLTAKLLDRHRKIIATNFPDTYRILCFNCNCGRERNGGICPHMGVVIDGPPVRNGATVRPPSPMPLFRTQSPEDEL